MKQFKKPLAQMGVLAFAAILNTATLFPLFYTLIDWAAGLMGHDARYASFEAAHPIYWGAWALFALFVGYYAVRLTLSIFITVAIKLNDKIENSDRLIAELEEMNKDYYVSMSKAFIVFFISAGMALFSLKLKFEQVTLENTISAQQETISNNKKRIEKLEDALEALNQSTQ
tara:strand:- start:3218 stop:3733 length:516 start_codon:yes stop_codon:yes gene_type:complete